MIGVPEPKEEQHTATWKLDKVELLAFLWPGDVRRDKRVHEGLEVGAPPLRQGIAHHPLIVYALSCKLRADWCKALVQSGLETLNLVVFGAEVVARAAIVSDSRHSIESRAELTA